MKPLKFMIYQRKPTQVMLTKEDNIYTINKYNIFEAIKEIVFLKMGKYEV